MARDIRNPTLHNYEKHLALPARFKTFELLHEEGFQHLCTLKEGRVIGVVVAAVVKDFGHICDKLCELVIMPLLQTGFHCRKVCKVDGEVCEINKKCEIWTETKELHHCSSRPTQADMLSLPIGSLITR